MKNPVGIHSKMCKAKSAQNPFLHRQLSRCTTTLDTAKTNNQFTAREVKRCFGPLKTILAVIFMSDDAKF